MSTLFMRRSLKYILIFLALFLTGGFFAFMAYYSEPTEVVITQAIAHENEALQPHYQAVDEKGQTYVIDAEKAYLKEGSESLIILKSPTFNMTLNNGTKIKVVAEQGFLDQDTKRLTLKGLVKVNYGDQGIFEMPITEIDLKLGSFFGDESLKGQMNQLNIQAGHFDIQERGSKITLTDHPVLRFKRAS